MELFCSTNKIGGVNEKKKKKKKKKDMTVVSKQVGEGHAAPSLPFYLFHARAHAHRHINISKGERKDDKKNA